MIKCLISYFSTSVHAFLMITYVNEAMINFSSLLNITVIGVNIDFFMFYMEGRAIGTD